MRQIVDNAGLDASIVVEKVRNLSFEARQLREIMETLIRKLDRQKTRLETSHSTRYTDWRDLAIRARS